MAFDFKRMERELAERGGVLTLDNGAKIIYENNPGLGLAYGTIHVGSGSLVEQPEHLGVMHFLEHMGFNGTKRDPSRKGLERKLTRLGAQRNANTNGRRVQYPIAGSNSTSFLMEDAFFHVFETYVGIVQSPLLREEDVEKERPIVLQEAREWEQSRSGPFREIVEIMQERLFGENHEPPTLGTEETIGAITAEVLRLYHREHFVGENTIVSLVGDIENGEDILARSVELVGALPKGEKSPAFPYKAERPFDGVELMEFDAPVPQPLTTVEVYYAVPGEDDFMIRNILAHVVGQRAFQEVREERGLVYSVGAQVHGHDGTRYITIQAKVNPDQLSDALQAIEGSVESVRSGLVEPDLIESLIQSIKPQHLMALRGNGWITEELVERLRARGRDRESFEGLRDVLSTTPEKIIAAANKYLGNDKLIYIVHANAQPTTSSVAQARVPYISSLL